MDVLVFILIYFVSFTIHLIWRYQYIKHFINNVGDLLDEIEPYMWIPIINTLVLLIIVVGIVIVKLWELSKLDVLWKKFRNIKLKK
jgi:hypothetical protein